MDEREAAVLIALWVLACVVMIRSIWAWPKALYDYPFWTRLRLMVLPVGDWEAKVRAEHVPALRRARWWAAIAYGGLLVMVCATAAYDALVKRRFERELESLERERARDARYWRELRERAEQRSRARKNDDSAPTR